MSDEMTQAVRRQYAQAAASSKVNRTGWTDQQWVDDARDLMGHIDGAITSLCNGHVMALLRMAARAEDAERRLADVLRDAAATLEGCAEGCDPLPFADTLRGVAQAYRDAAAAHPGTDTSDGSET